MNRKYVFIFLLAKVSSFWNNLIRKDGLSGSVVDFDSVYSGFHRIPFGVAAAGGLFNRRFCSPGVRCRRR